MLGTLSLSMTITIAQFQNCPTVHIEYIIAKFEGHENEFDVNGFIMAIGEYAKSSLQCD